MWAAPSKLHKRGCNSMSTHDEKEPQKEAIAETPKNKRPYIKPAFQYEKVFETMALSCGKVAGTTQEQCRNNRKAS